MKTKLKLDVCETQIPPSPTYEKIGLTFDLDLSPTDLKLLWQTILDLPVTQGVGDQHDLWPWPTDLNINRDHLLLIDYLPSKFEVYGTKRSWVINCTRCGLTTWPLTLTFDPLTWLSIQIIYLSRTIYLPSVLSFWGKALLSYQLHKVWRPTWPLYLLPVEFCHIWAVAWENLRLGQNFSFVIFCSKIIVML